MEPDSSDVSVDGGRRERGWPRAAAALIVAMMMSVVPPAVLVGVPFVALGVTSGVRRVRTVAAVVFAALLAVAGWPRDGLWYLERAWALLVGGAFAAITLVRPRADTSSRALASVFGAFGGAALLLALRAGSWGAVDGTVAGRIDLATSRLLDLFREAGEGSIQPDIVTVFYQTAAVQAAVFPAMLGLASMAALGFAWWAYRRLSDGSDHGLGPLREYRFNDHLVWLFIGGIVLLFVHWSDPSARVGSNAVVFMGALYAVRGAAVILFMSGGLSALSYLVLAVAFLLVPPLVVGTAVMIGLGDTWLRFRARAARAAS